MAAELMEPDTLECFIEDGKIDRLGIREAIFSIEKKMLEAVDIQIKIEPKHHFSKGLYAREIFIPKGTLLTGKIHKHEHLNIISQGDISVLTEFGVQRVKAPFTLISQPGTKRLGYTNEDTVWTTIHVTSETDLEKIEEEFILTSYESIDLSASDIAALRGG